MCIDSGSGLLSWRISYLSGHRLSRLLMYTPCGFCLHAHDWYPDEVLTNQTTIDFQINMMRRRESRYNGESICCNVNLPCMRFLVTAACRRWLCGYVVHACQARFFRNPYDMGRSRNCQEVFGVGLSQTECRCKTAVCHSTVRRVDIQFPPSCWESFSSSCHIPTKPQRTGGALWPGDFAHFLKLGRRSEREREGGHSDQFRNPL